MVLGRLLGAAVAVSAVVAVVMSGCGGRFVEPLRLEGNLLTVTNDTADEWSGVEIWLNGYFRVSTPSIPSGGRLQVPLDTFVAGFGQRFNFARAQIRELRLTAKLPGGKSLELKKPFTSSGLAGAFGGKK